MVVFDPNEMVVSKHSEIKSIIKDKSYCPQLRDFEFSAVNYIKSHLPIKIDLLPF
jgi:hypothetical protein